MALNNDQIIMHRFGGVARSACADCNKFFGNATFIKHSLVEPIIFNDFHVNVCGRCRNARAMIAAGEREMEDFIVNDDGSDDEEKHDMVANDIVDDHYVPTAGDRAVVMGVGGYTEEEWEDISTTYMATEMRALVCFLCGEADQA